MKASELRIGNYIRLDDMCASNFHVLDEVPKQENELYRWIEPIPLTEEWLVKFGFEVTDTKREQYFMWVNRGRKLRVLKGIKRVGYKFFAASEGFYFDCNYVHQLQNLYFALTNEELTLKQN